jgi:hypothetical protein
VVLVGSVVTYDPFRDLQMWVDLSSNVGDSCTRAGW